MASDRPRVGAGFPHPWLIFLLVVRTSKNLGKQGGSTGSSVRKTLDESGFGRFVNHNYGFELNVPKVLIDIYWVNGCILFKFCFFRPLDTP
jgi:hypothetical protein